MAHSGNWKYENDSSSGISPPNEAGKISASIRLYNSLIPGVISIYIHKDFTIMTINQYARGDCRTST